MSENDRVNETIRYTLKTCRSAARRQALEEAAALCDAEANYCGPGATEYDVGYENGKISAADACAAAIRALLDKEG